jgi:hypothetical protein
MTPAVPSATPASIAETGAYHEWDLKSRRRARGAAPVEVRIGVTQSPREIEVELGDDADADRLAKQLGEALTSEAGIFWLTDRKGRRVGVPAAKVAYVEIGSPTEERRVGFGARTVS